MRSFAPPDRQGRQTKSADASRALRRPALVPGSRHLHRLNAQNEDAPSGRTSGPEAKTRSVGGGRQLTREQRAYFEPRFGADFSQVRLHTDGSADSAARALDARAYTSGSDIVFRKGQYRPDSSAGRELLAHELTHVVQQQGRPAGIQQARVEPVDSPAEREADRVAAQVMAGGRAPAVRHAPVGVPRAPLKSNGGEFVMTRYDAHDDDPGKDTRKQCGVDLTITFTPAKALRSDQISFVQIMKAEKGGALRLFPHEQPRATTAAQGAAGWTVDQLEGQKNADYTIANDGKERAAWGDLGYRKGDADSRDATLIDEVRLFRDPGETYKVQATSFALDKTNSKYLGGVAWGYTVNAKGAVTKTAAKLKSKGAPTGIQKAALKQWNAQAKNADVSKRNAPDQVEITVP